MNAAEKARMDYLHDLPSMEFMAAVNAGLKAAEYTDAFNASYSRMEIRRAGERAHWNNIVLPLIKAAKRNHTAVV